MGKLSLGQGNTATNGTSETDLSGTGIASYSIGGGGSEGLQFQQAGVNTTTIGAAFTNLDGGSRRDRIRYDTPTFAGFRASTSASQGERYDVALRYANQFAGARVAGSIGYQNTNAANAAPAGNAEEDRVSGSISVLLDNGFNVTFAAANANREVGDDRTFYYGKVGFQTNSVSQYGRTSFSIDYYEGEDIAASGSGDSTSYSFAAVQNLDPIGASVYLGVRNHELDNTDDDVFAIFVGSRIRF